jgi:hypothetical protein
MLNTDGAFSPVTNKGGWGVRDNDGDLIVAEASSVSDAIDALHTKTMAVLKAITMAVRLGFGRIIVATDCQNLQRALTSSDYDMAELGALFREAKFLLRTEFIDHHITFESHVCNKPAHALAALGLAVKYGWIKYLLRLVGLYMATLPSNFNGMYVFHVKKKSDFRKRKSG